MNYPETTQSRDPLISFCITCMGRLHHLRLTLPDTIGAISESPHCVEVVVLNYNSADGLDDWMKSTAVTWIKLGQISYYHLDYPQYFRMSHAKNCAHRLARGRVLCNLDADNYIDDKFIDSLAENIIDNRTILRSKDTIHHSTDLCGRIAMSQSLFAELGGYDETMLARNWEDIDIIERGSKILGAQVIEDTNSIRFISHSNYERALHYEEKMKKVCAMNNNFNISAINLHNKTANPNLRNGIVWGNCIVRRNWEPHLIQTGSNYVPDSDNPHKDIIK